MSEEIATKYERLHSGAMHDLNLAALADYPGPRPESPAAEMLTESSRIALSTQAIATETMACAGFLRSLRRFAPARRAGERRCQDSV